MKKPFQSIYSNCWGELFFIVYFFLAWYFYQERTLFLDNAFQVFLMLQDQYIEVNANRWPAVVYRFLPFALSKLNVGLSSILLSFSLSYVVIQYLIYSIIQHVLSDRRNALVYILILSLTVVHGFFWCNSELVLALCLTILWASLFKAKKYLLSTTIALCLAWVHPLVIFAFSFTIIYLFLERKEFDYKSIIPIITFYITYFVNRLFFPNWYDTAKSQLFEKNLKEYDWQSHWGGFNLLQEFDYQFLIIGLIAMIILMFQKKYLNTLLLLFSTIFYLLVVDISRGSSAFKFEFYEEINLYLISFFVFISISHIWVKLPVKYYWLIAGFISLWSAYRWCSHSTFYASRIEWYRELLKTNDRVIINASQFEDSPLTMEWASAYETLIISSLDGECKSFVITKDDSRFREDLNSGMMLTEFRKYPYQKMNQRYFPLDEKAYEIIILD